MIEGTGTDGSRTANSVPWRKNYSGLKNARLLIHMEAKDNKLEAEEAVYNYEEHVIQRQSKVPRR